MTDQAFIRLALQKHRNSLVGLLRLRAFVRSVHAEFAVTGVDGIERVAVFAWPDFPGRATRMLVDVVRVNDRVLAEPVTFDFALEPGERPRPRNELPPVVVIFDEVEGPRPHAEYQVLRVDGPAGPIEWTKVNPLLRGEKEVEALGKDGKPVLRDVNTTTYCYRMACACGRIRYSKANSLHQVAACRVCTRQARLRKRALTQYRQRFGVPRSP